MTQTSTTDTYSVTDGDRTTVTIDEGGPINILSADIRWKGDTIEEERIEEDVSTNTGYLSPSFSGDNRWWGSTPSGRANPEWENEGEFAKESSLEDMVNNRNHWKNFEYDKRRIILNVSNFSWSKTAEVEYVFDDINGDEVTGTITVPPTSSEQITSQSSSEPPTGDRTRSAKVISSLDTDDVKVEYWIQTRFKFDSTTLGSSESRFERVDIPDPEYDLEKVELEIRSTNTAGSSREYDFQIQQPGSYLNDFNISGTLSGGESEKIASTTVNYGDRIDVVDETEPLVATDIESDITVETHSEQTVTDEFDTESPSVSGDVSGSYNGSVPDGSWSNWQSLSGLEQGSHSIRSSIDGSEKADFQIRYEWEYETPTATYELQVQQNPIHTVAITEVDDPALEYNTVRVWVNGNEYAIDVVDPTDELAISEITFSTPHGELSPRSQIDN